MLRLLPFVVIIAGVIGAFIYVIFFYHPGPKGVILTGFDSASTQVQVDTLKDRVTDLENKISPGMNDKPQASNAPAILQQSTTSFSTDLNTKVTNLEKTVADLQIRVIKLENATPPPSTQVSSSSNKYPLYIPLGTGGQIGDKNWNTTGTYQVTIDPANYPGYKNMQLEINSKMAQSSGQANFRLFNNSDNSALSSSDVSTTSSNYTWVTSGGFTLTSGSKTYILQIQSTQGYDVFLQNARIKVNF